MITSNPFGRNAFVGRPSRQVLVTLSRDSFPLDLGLAMWAKIVEPV
jgi:hypothetical protein